MPGHVDIVWAIAIVFPPHILLLHLVVVVVAVQVGVVVVVVVVMAEKVFTTGGEYHPFPLLCFHHSFTWELVINLRIKHSFTENLIKNISKIENLMNVHL